MDLALIAGQIATLQSDALLPLTDHFAADDSTWCGDSYIVCLRPNATQSATNWTNESGGSATYQSVDDIVGGTIDSDSTFVQSTSANAVFSVGLESASSRGIPPGSTIVAVKGIAVCRDESQVVAWQIGLNWNGTDTYLTTLDGGASYEGRNILRTTNGGGGAIAYSDLSTLRVQVKRTQSQARNLRCTEMALMVEFIPPPIAQTFACNQAVKRGAFF